MSELEVFWGLLVLAVVAFELFATWRENREMRRRVWVRHLDEERRSRRNRKSQ